MSFTSSSKQQSATRILKVSEPIASNSRANSLQEKIRQLDEQEEAKSLSRIVRLSRCNLPLTIVLGLIPVPLASLLSFCSYLYTRRWLPLLAYLLGACLVSVAVYTTEKEENRAADLTAKILLVYMTVVPPIDNGFAVVRSRERLKDMSR